MSVTEISRPIDKAEWLLINNMLANGVTPQTVARRTSRNILDVRWCWKTPLSQVSPGSSGFKHKKTSPLRGRGDDYLRSWYNKKSTGVIADDLSAMLNQKITKNMVIGRANRLGLSEARYG